MFVTGPFQVELLHCDFVRVYESAVPVLPVQPADFVVGILPVSSPRRSASRHCDNHRHEHSSVFLFGPEIRFLHQRYYRPLHVRGK